VIIMKNCVYYEFIITRRKDNKIVSKRVIKSDYDIRIIHYDEWLNYKFHFGKSKPELYHRDYKIQSRKLSDEEKQQYIRYPYGLLFENQVCPEV